MLFSWHLMRIGIRSSLRKHVKGGADPGWSAIEDMGVNHRGLDVAMARKFLHRADVIAAFEQMSRERVPERVAGGPLRQTRPRNRLPHCVLDERLVRVMAPLSCGPDVPPPVPSREDPLPAPIAGRIGAFEDVPVQEEEGREGLVLRRGADLLFDGRVGEGGVDLRLGRLGWVADVVKEAEPAHPVAAGLFGTAAVMAAAEGLPGLVEGSGLALRAPGQPPIGFTHVVMRLPQCGHSRRRMCLPPHPRRM